MDVAGKRFVVIVVAGAFGRIAGALPHASAVVSRRELPRTIESLHRELDRRVRFTAAEREKYCACLVTEIGPPFLTIINYAKREPIDLIVMGTHGRGAIAHLLIGSVAENVVRKAPCPVLTVRHPEHEFITP